MIFKIFYKNTKILRRFKLQTLPWKYKLFLNDELKYGGNTLELGNVIITKIKLVK